MAHGASDYNLTFQPVVSGAGLLPVGTIKAWPVATIPALYVECNGQAISRSTYSVLFGVIGTTYGAGDGSTTFNVPNMSGKIGVGYKGSDSNFQTLGQSGGEETHTLVISELPTHTHPMVTGTSSTGGNHTVSCNTYSKTAISSCAGSDGAHNNLQPYIVMKFVICAGV
jgi:microcystin-dependent protein